MADRTTESATALLSTLPEQRRNEVAAVAVDRWVPFMTAVGTTRMPLLFTTSFISSVILQQWLTRCGELTEPKSVANENKTLRAAGIDDLVESLYTWLRNPDKWTQKDKDTFYALQSKG